MFLADQPGDLVAVLVKQLLEKEQHLGPSGRGRIAPHRKGRRGSRNGLLHRGVISQRYPANCQPA